MNLMERLTRSGASSARSGAEANVQTVPKRRLAAALALIALGGLLTVSCGGSSSSPSIAPSGPGALYTFVSDTPACDVLGFSMYILEMQLHVAGAPPTSLVTVFPTNASLISPVIEMSSLREAMTLINGTSLPAGTYDQVILNVVYNGGSIYDPTQSPPVSAYSASATTSSVTISLQPPLTITSGNVSGLKLDLNLPNTLGVDAQGQLSGHINWFITGQTIAANSTTGFGDMDDLYGIVRSINPSITNSTFKSSFSLQTLAQTATFGSTGGPAINVYLNDQTNLCMGGVCNVPVSQINQLTTGNYAEVDGYINSLGDMVANTIQIEDREQVTQNLLAYVGPVLDVTRDAAGDVTQFDMLARETEPSDHVNIPNFTTIAVNVPSSTTFNPYLLSSDLTNLAGSGNLALSSSTLAPGQDVVVNGVFTKPSGGPISVVANSVYPRLQSVQGTFSSLVGSPGSDNKTGGFAMAPCSGIFGNYPFMVVTDGQTQFINTSGLSTLSPTSPVLARGLLYLNQQNTTIQGTGTAVPAGTMVLLAKQVHQF